MDVSVIIVNYNTRQMTDEAINSVYEHTSGVDFEIILVDNASADGSKEFFEKKKGITYVYSQENLGFGKGNNLGLEYVKGRNVLFLNSDTLLRNNAIKILSDYMDANPDVGICGGNLFNHEGKPAVSYEIKRPSFARELNRVLGGRIYKYFYKDITFNSSKKVKEVGYVSGADFMTRKSILDKYGAFSPEFFMYYEETELANRINNAGFKIVSVPEAEIIHLEGMSLKKNKSEFNERKYTWMSESFWKYLKASNSKSSIFFIKLVHVINFRLRIRRFYLSRKQELLSIEKTKYTLFMKSYKKIICQ